MLDVVVELALAAPTAFAEAAADASDSLRIQRASERVVGTGSGRVSSRRDDPIESEERSITIYISFGVRAFYSDAHHWQFHRLDDDEDGL